jgi:hypothetical protein
MAGMPAGKWPLGRTRHSGMDNTDIGLADIEWVSVDWISMA